MSYDDYVNHIVKKYRLAISLSVIKTKPENMTLEGYMQHLRSKINEDQNSDNLSVSVCSDDFRFDDTDQTVITIDENNYQYNNENDKNNQQTEVNIAEIIDRPDLVNFAVNINQSNSKTNSYESIHNNDETYQNETNDIEMINTQDLNDSVTILQNFELDTAGSNEINSETGQRRSLGDVIEILKSIDDNVTTVEKGISNKKSTHNNNLKAQASKQTEISQSIDNDATLCKSLDILYNSEKYRLSQEHNCDSHNDNQKDGQTDNNMQIVDGHINSKETNTIKKNNISNTELDTSTGKIETKSNYDTKQNNVNLEAKTKMSERKLQSNLREYRNTKGFKNIYQNIADVFDTTKSKDVYKDTKVNDPDKIVTSEKCKELPSEPLHTVMYSTSNDFTCNTHYSESQTNALIIIEDKLIHRIHKNNNKQQNKENEQTKSTLPMNNSQRYEANSSINNKQNSKDNEKYNKSIFLTSTSTISNQTFDDNINKYGIDADRTLKNIQDNKKDPKDKKYDKNRVQHIDQDLFSQESELTNFSTLSTNKGENNLTGNTIKFSQDAHNTDKYFAQLGTQKTQGFTDNNKNNEELSPKNCDASDENFENMPLINAKIGRNTNLDVNLENRQVTNEFRSIEHDNNLEFAQVKNNKTCADFDKNLDNRQRTEITKPCTKLDENFKNMLATETCTNFDGNLDNMEVEDDWTDSQIELIPFKVIEELNKIKVFLNKRNEKKLSAEGYSSDTGYRSDSQSKNSFKMSQPDSGWLDQSAHCIFSYIIECPLAVTTQDITNEISVESAKRSWLRDFSAKRNAAANVPHSPWKRPPNVVETIVGVNQLLHVLGHLIDRLHEEEKYPSFLEELLETVELLLGLVYGDNSSVDVLMQKDETIQRIFLLNKSIHIQRYTIEKITYILESVHTELTTADTMYEIQNIERIENICHIFHILEILLQKYNKTSKKLSQTTQSSQEERTLKKSNITDIWRKKWNPNYKEPQNEGSVEKICILSSCSTILNKLIVGCMDGYSLVSYFALKCFNVMQT